MGWLKQLLEMAQILLRLTDDLKRTREDVKELRQEMRELSDAVNALSAQSIQTRGQRSRQRFAFAGLHFHQPAVM